MWYQIGNTFILQPINFCLNDYSYTHSIVLTSFYKKQLTLNVRAYFGTISFIPLNYMSIFMPISQFLLLQLFSKFELGKYESFNFALLFQNLFDFSRFHVFQYAYQNQLVNFYKKSMWDFDSGCLESLGQFGDYCYLDTTES